MKKKNHILLMLSDINKLDMTHDEMAMNDSELESLRDIVP